MKKNIIKEGTIPLKETFEYKKQLILLIKLVYH